jgi:hypothetical protein
MPSGLKLFWLQLNGGRITILSGQRAKELAKLAAMVVKFAEYQYG